MCESFMISLIYVSVTSLFVLLWFSIYRLFIQYLEDYFSRLNAVFCVLKYYSAYILLNLKEVLKFCSRNFKSANNSSILYLLYREHISSNISRNSKTNAPELQENLVSLLLVVVSHEENMISTFFILNYRLFWRTLNIFYESCE